jgi:transposase-like protein
MVAAQLAVARDQAASGARSSRLGEAVAGQAQDLAAARREITVLKRDNAALRSQLELAGPG